MRRLFLVANFGIVIASLAACATANALSELALTEDNVVDLIEHPQKWGGRFVTIGIYPYDNGFTGSYVVCFERCDAAYAEKSPFLIYTKPERFRGYRGDRSTIVQARYSSACFYKSTLCPDQRFGLFTEVTDH